MPKDSFKFWPGSLELENKTYHLQIANRLQSLFVNANGYLAYKMTNLGRADADQVPSFIIVTQEHGVILLDVVEELLNDIQEKDETEFWLIGDEYIQSKSIDLQIYEEDVKGRIRNDITLYSRAARQLLIPIRSYILFCENQINDLQQYSLPIEGYGATMLDIDTFEDVLMQAELDEPLSTTHLDKVISLLEGTFVYQDKVTYKEDSPPQTINDFIQLSLKSTFKQDDLQRAVSMQLPDGPQRIRGLAGTGKTIVLSLKAAITHKRLSEFKILYLFNTQSLYGAVSSLITKYYSSEAKKSPDFSNKLHILHAWGGRSKPGLYSELCNQFGLTPMNFTQMRYTTDPLKVIYKDLLNKVGDKLEPIYDLVLIDEAQDFPEEVFEVVFKITKSINGKKRIVWAYDEFQSLKEVMIKEPADLFGKKDGQPNMPNSVLEGEYAGGIKKTLFFRYVTGRHDLC